MIIFHLLHLRSKFITFIVSQIITFMVKVLLHLWLVIYYIYGKFLLHVRCVLHLWLTFITLVLHLWMIITFMGDTD